MADNALIRRLDGAGGLPVDDRATLRRLCSPKKHSRADEDLVRTGDRPEGAIIVLSGFMCRYKVLSDGRRHIGALLVPGDFCDPRTAILAAMDHSIMSLTPCTYVKVPHVRLLDLMDGHPGIARAIWWASLVDISISREWVSNLGRRDADKRTAHLFCELHARLQQVGLVTADAFDLSITQPELGDVLGISAVQVNRTLQRLRGEGLIAFRRGQLRIPDLARLHAFCGFNPRYLHLTPRQDAPSP